MQRKIILRNEAKRVLKNTRRIALKTSPYISEIKKQIQGTYDEGQVVKLIRNLRLFVRNENLNSIRQAKKLNQ